MKARKETTKRTATFLESGVATASCLLVPMTQGDDTHALMQEVGVIVNYTTGIDYSEAASESSMTSRRMATPPITLVGEILEFIRGVIIRQRSGEGKANQYFLHDYNLYHDTNSPTCVGEMMPTIRAAESK